MEWSTTAGPSVPPSAAPRWAPLLRPYAAGAAGLACSQTPYALHSWCACVQLVCPLASPLHSLQAPQWAVDGSGVAWLLLPVMHCAINAAAAAALAAQFGSSDDDDAARDVGTLVLAPLDAVSEALEAEGSRLSPSLLLSISQPVANFSSAQGLQFAANCDCSMVAWCESGRLHVHFRGSGVSHPVWPQPQEMRSTVMREAIREQGRYPTDSSLVGPMWMDSVVIAMQWSPDGRRLLLLLRHPNARECCQGWR